MSARFPFSFLPPSLGDRLLAGASVAKLTLCRWPGGDTEVEYQLQGTLPAGDRAIAELVREMQLPLPARPEDQDGVA